MNGVEKIFSLQSNMAKQMLEAFYWLKWIDALFDLDPVLNMKERIPTNARIAKQMDSRKYAFMSQI